MDKDRYRRGDVWLVDLESENGDGRARARLALIFSTDKFNNGPADVVVVLPITTRCQNVPTHVRIAPPEAGTNKDIYILCERIQTVATDRLLRVLGTVSPQTMRHVEDRVSIILDLFSPV